MKDFIIILTILVVFTAMSNACNNSPTCAPIVFTPRNKTKDDNNWDIFFDNYGTFRNLEENMSKCRMKEFLGGGSFTGTMDFLLRLKCVKRGLFWELHNFLGFQDDPERFTRPEVCLGLWSREVCERRFQENINLTRDEYVKNCITTQAPTLKYYKKTPGCSGVDFTWFLHSVLIYASNNLNMDIFKGVWSSKKECQEKFFDFVRVNEKIHLYLPEHDEHPHLEKFIGGF